MAKGLTMNKPIAKVTKRTGSSRSESVPLQARRAWHSRLVRRAATWARSSGPPCTGGVLAGAPSVRTGSYSLSHFGSPVL